MLIDCHNCKAKVDAELLCEHNDEDFFATKTFFLKCPSCDAAIVAESKEDFVDKKTVWSRPVRVYPRPKRALGSDIPPIVRNSIDEAEKCIQSGAYLAATAMCGRSLEAICRHYKTKDSYLGGGLRACSKSPENQRQKSQADELQTGVEFTLAVFPKSAALLQPSKRSLYDPALRNHLEGVKLVALGDLDRRAQCPQHLIGKLFTGVRAVRQNTLYCLQIFRTTLKGLHCSSAVADISCRDRHCMWQPLRVYRQVTLDPRYFLARVVSLAA